MVHLLHPEKDGGLFTCQVSNLVRQNAIDLKWILLVLKELLVSQAGSLEFSRSVRVERLSDWEHGTVRTLLVVVFVTSIALVVLLGVVCYCCRRHKVRELN